MSTTRHESSPSWSNLSISLTMAFDTSANVMTCAPVPYTVGLFSGVTRGQNSCNPTQESPQTGHFSTSSCRARGYCRHVVFSLCCRRVGVVVRICPHVSACLSLGIDFCPTNGTGDGVWDSPVQQKRQTFTMREVHHGVQSKVKSTAIQSCCRQAPQRLLQNGVFSCTILFILLPRILRHTPEPCRASFGGTPSFLAIHSDF